MVPVVMVALVVYGFLAVSLVAGFAVGARWRRPDSESEKGIKFETLIAPLVTLTTLMLSFTLVQVYSSFQSSRQAETLEASRILFQFEKVGFYGQKEAEPLRATLICYTRSVAYEEFPAMADHPEAVQVVTHWTEHINTDLADLRAVDDGQPFGTLLSADKERGDQRNLRIAQAGSSVPVEFQALLLITTALAVGTLAVFVSSSSSRRRKIAVLGVVTIVLGTFLVAIDDLQNQYSGSIVLFNDNFVAAETKMTELFADTYGPDMLPCDAQGTPI